MSVTKPSNPKDIIGSGKMPLHLFPAAAIALGSLGLLEGMVKYGRSNWRAVGIRRSIYVDALLRHVYKLMEGEDADEDSGLPHEAHILACAAIMVDAKAAGKLNDDRLYPGGFPEFLKSLTPHVERIKTKYADKNPHHYSIQDVVHGNGDVHNTANNAPSVNTDFFERMANNAIPVAEAAVDDNPPWLEPFPLDQGLPSQTLTVGNPSEGTLPIAHV